MADGLASHSNDGENRVNEDLNESGPPTPTSGNYSGSIEYFPQTPTIAMASLEAMLNFSTKPFTAPLSDRAGSRVITSESL